MLTPKDVAGQKNSKHYSQRAVTVLCKVPDYIQETICQQSRQKLAVHTKKVMDAQMFSMFHQFHIAT